MDHKTQLAVLLGSVSGFIHIYCGPTQHEYGCFTLGMKFYSYDAQNGLVIKDSIKPFDDRLSAGANLGRVGSLLPF